jgi:hypothetical protein
MGAAKPAFWLPRMCQFALTQLILPEPGFLKAETGSF